MSVAKNLTIQNHVGGAFHRVRIDVSTPAVVGRQMKYDLHSTGSLIAKGRVEKVAFEGFAFDVCKVASFSAGKVFGHPHIGSSLNELFAKVGADEGCSTGNEYFFVIPIHNFKKIIWV
jgi:hypothetical protein